MVNISVDVVINKVAPNYKKKYKSYVRGQNNNSTESGVDNILDPYSGLASTKQNKILSYR